MKQICKRMWQNALQCARYVSHFERCAIKSFTTLHFIGAHRDFAQLPWFVRHELMPCLRRGAPVVIKIFKKLYTLKHFMAVPPTTSGMHRSSILLPLVHLPRPPPFAVALELFLSRSKSRQPDRAGEQHPLVL